MPKIRKGLPFPSTILFSFIHNLPNIKGEYQRPPNIKLEKAASITA
jgi:hypothetical protein